jgi:hypothetical protein
MLSPSSGCFRAPAMMRFVFTYLALLSADEAQNIDYEPESGDIRITDSIASSRFHYPTVNSSLSGLPSLLLSSPSGFISAAGGALHASLVCTTGNNKYLTALLQVYFQVDLLMLVERRCCLYFTFVVMVQQAEHEVNESFSPWELTGESLIGLLHCRRADMHHLISHMLLIAGTPHVTPPQYSLLDLHPYLFALKLLVIFITGVCPFCAPSSCPSATTNQLPSRRIILSSRPLSDEE